MTSAHDTGGATDRIRAALHAEVAKVVVGQGQTVDAVLAALAVGGHLLLEGPPGVAKSLLASAIGRACGLQTRRVQFTPDLLPSDLTGSLALRGNDLVFREGPIFTNILLADEINRTPPKTQAALLEAMQERQVTVDGHPRPLPDPFVVLATENPIEYEGTYPLPEAQLDRFLMKLTIHYPSAADEEGLLRLRHSGVAPSTLDDVRAVGDAGSFRAVRDEADAVTVSDPIVSYVAGVVRRTRELPSVSLGASPRAAVHLLAAAKAWARISGRSYVIPDEHCQTTDAGACTSIPRWTPGIPARPPLTPGVRDRVHAESC
jgi:MoxR-like ATPase